MSFQEDVESGRIGRMSSRANRDGGDQPPQSVAHAVFKFKTAVDSFRHLVGYLGTPRDTINFRQNLHKRRIQIGDVMRETLAKLKQASETDRGYEVDAAKRIADAKLAKDFRTLLKDLEKAQRLAAEKEATYTPFVPRGPPIHYRSNTAANEEESNDPGHVSVSIDSKSQEVLLLDPEVVFNEALIEEREQGIQEIQQQIGEVNEIFKDLAVLVHGQGILIDDISSNIETSHNSTTQAASQLVQASKIRRKSASSLICLLLVIFGVILVILVILLVV